MKTGGIKLGINIDHVATLRQARRTLYPDVVAAALLCERAGAHGITAHLREDRRHIQDEDIRALRRRIATRLNLEMSVSADIVALALEVRPHEACLVPERREELTTEGGLDAAGLRRELSQIVPALRAAGVAVSLFIDPVPQQVDAAAEVGAAFVELHTGTFVARHGAAAHDELTRLYAAAERAHAAGLGVNAGHGLTLGNIGPILRLPWLDTLNIGHSLVADALFVGLEQAVRAMLDRIDVG